MSAGPVETQPQRGKGDDGFTLVEQIVVLAVLGIVLIIVFGFLMNATSMTARADASVRAEQAAINGLRTVTEDLRSAATISSCSGLTFDKCVTVEISQVTQGTADCPKRVVVYQVVSNKLRQTLTDYAANCTTVTKTGQIDLIENVQSTSIFTFYQSDGVTPLNLSSATDVALVPSTPAVKAAVTVKYRKDAPNLSYSSIASLRNNR